MLLLLRSIPFLFRTLALIPRTSNIGTGDYLPTVEVAVAVLVELDPFVELAVSTLNTELK